MGSERVREDWSNLAHLHAHVPIDEPGEHHAKKNKSDTEGQTPYATTYTMNLK